ncbi:hypothetical protein, partial [Bartonella sp. CL46QHWL]|uniref:hypothetical protein n=1 Tax=Bartonella sp. CL46QHWL TaxID=3243534 RepID=UPI0035CFB919
TVVVRTATKLSFIRHGNLSLRFILGCESSTTLTVSNSADPNTTRKEFGSSSGTFLWMPK